MHDIILIWRISEPLRQMPMLSKSSLKNVLCISMSTIRMFSVSVAQVWWTKTLFGSGWSCRNIWSKNSIVTSYLQHTNMQEVLWIWLKMYLYRELTKLHRVAIRSCPEMTSLFYAGEKSDDDGSGEGVVIDGGGSQPYAFSKPILGDIISGPTKYLWSSSSSVAGTPWKETGDGWFFALKLAKVGKWSVGFAPSASFFLNRSFLFKKMMVGVSRNVSKRSIFSSMWLSSILKTSFSLVYGITILDPISTCWFGHLPQAPGQTRWQPPGRWGTGLRHFETPGSIFSSRHADPQHQSGKWDIFKILFTLHKNLQSSLLTKESFVGCFPPTDICEVCGSW